MKILMVTAYAPYPPNNGARMRLWAQIQYLGQRHDLTVASFIFSEAECEHRAMLEDYCRRVVLIRHSQKLPPAARQERLQFPEFYFWYGVPEMKQALIALQKTIHFDVVLIEQIFMAQYAELFSTCVVLQEQNIESNIARQLARLKKNIDGRELTKPEQLHQHFTWMQMAKYENETWPKFPLRVTVSQADKQEIDRRCAAGKTVVIENGINTQMIQPVANNASRKILFMGSMEYPPNVDAVFYFAETILPLIWQKDSTVQFCVAGLNPSPAIQALAADSRIEVIANPENMAEVAQKCKLTVVPLRAGGGTRIKILHALAMGLPVVSTSLGCEGLALVDGQHLLVRDEPAQFANAVLQILTQTGLSAQLRIQGRQLVEKKYDWRYMFESLETEMAALVHNLD